MIVDDNPIDQRITSHVYKSSRQNTEVIVMEGAIQALDYLKKHKDQPEHLPSLILLDLDMPEMNGYDFLQQLKDYAADLPKVCPVIVVTGSEIASDIEKMKADPHVIKLIPKPLNKLSFAF